ncbi:MAG: hypothetical protein RIQ89_860 [Bacteroidota bacterium]|jgi:MraZ protein
MAGYIGEFPCTVDNKGRFLLPMGLKKQIPAKEQRYFVVNRGFEKHLVLFTKKEWEAISDKVNAKNIFIKKNRDFIRKFNNGATPLELDASNRLLLPKSLLDYAGIEKDMVIFAYGNRIELWSQKAYDAFINADSSDMADLAEAVMGKKEEEDELS